MAISDARGVRHVRCPRCHSVLQEPNAPVYQCGACGTSLRAKNYTGSAQQVAISAPSLESGLPPQSKHLGSDDAPGTSAFTTTSRCEVGEPMPERKHWSVQVPAIEEQEQERDRSSSQEDNGNDNGGSDPRGERGVGVAECTGGGNARSVRRNSSKRSKYEAEMKGSEKRKEVEARPEPDAATEFQSSEKKRVAESEPGAEIKKGSGEAAQPRTRETDQAAPAPAVVARGDDAAAPAPAAEGKAASPPRHALQPQNLSPLHKKILRTVDELKGDLSELFSKSPEVQPRSAARPPRLPKQEAHVSRSAMAMARGLPASRARHAAAAAHHPSKAGQVAPVGLPSRRYRQCRANPCCHGGPCHHAHACCNHGKPECGSCRGHCCRPRAPAPGAAPPRKPPAKEAKRPRAPPRNHCRPVLKGAPFIVCSSCFQLVQVPADFAVASRSVRKLRCGACSAVLSYSYRDPARKKHQLPVDQCSTDGSEAGYVYARRTEPFSFVEDFGHVVSYSTEDEQPLHVSRNSSFDTVDEVAAGVAAQQSSSLHRLMGYGSASDLLFRQHSPDLYESFDKRTTTTPDEARQYDRKGKGICLDVDDADDDSDEEFSSALKRSAVRRAGLALPRTPIRIRS